MRRAPAFQTPMSAATTRLGQEGAVAILHAGTVLALCGWPWFDVQLIAPLFGRFDLWLEMQESRRSVEASCCLLGHVRQVMVALLEYGRAV